MNLLPINQGRRYRYFTVAKNDYCSMTNVIDDPDLKRSVPKFAKYVHNSVKNTLEITKLVAGMQMTLRHLGKISKNSYLTPDANSAHVYRELYTAPSWSSAFNPPFDERQPTSICTCPREEDNTANNPLIITLIF